MRLSIFTDELGLDIAEALPVIAEWGLEHVDLRGRVLGGHFESLEPGQLPELKALLEEHGMTVGCLESSLAKVHLPDRERRREEEAKLENIIRAADALDCRLVRAFHYWHPPKERVGDLAVRPDDLQKSLTMFAPLAERARGAGLTLAFENCGTTTDEELAFLDALDQPGWGLAWDVHSSWSRLREREDRADYMSRLAKATRVVHVKAKGAVQGLGQPIPYDRVLGLLHNTGYEGPVSAETHNPDRATDNVEQSHKVVVRLKRAWPSAAPGMVGEEAEPARETVRDYEPVGFVVVGLGMGKNRSRLVQETPGTRLVGVCDIDRERADAVSEELGVPGTYRVEDWLDDDEVEAVYVLTPTGRHAEVGLKALKAGKHVLTTKPMEASLQACDAMIREAEKCDRLLGVDFGMRFRSENLSLKAAVEEGRLGKVLSGSTSLRVLRTMDYFRANGGWRGTRRWDGGGVLSNQNIHHLDQIAFAVGIPHRVRCNIWTQDHDIEAEDLGCGVLQYGDGAVITLYATTCYPQSTWYHSLELHGTEGAVSLARGGPLEESTRRWYVDGEWRDEPPTRVESEWLNAADNFAAALRTGADLVCSGRDGRRTQSILHALYKSAYGDRDWVEVKPELRD
ncbi:MAG: Gfo/Idh/MocA family oxidoreductase [Planctomycetota bacterium]